MSDKLQEIRDSLEKITSAPWFAGYRSGQCHIKHQHGKGDCVYELILVPDDDWVETTAENQQIFEYDYEGSRIKRPEDAHFIANAPQYIRILLDEVDRLHREIADKKSQA